MVISYRVKSQEVSVESKESEFVPVSLSQLDGSVLFPYSFFKENKEP